MFRRTEDNAMYLIVLQRVIYIYIYIYIYGNTAIDASYAETPFAVQKPYRS